jgi:hypothetical protein
MTLHKVDGIRLNPDATGETAYASAGWLGNILVGFAGYLGPSLFGLAAAKLIELGHSEVVLWLALFLLALLLVRGLPALLYSRLVGRRRAAVAGLMQATTLTFVIVASQIGLAAGQITPTESASLLAAGLLSAALFPSAALRLLATRGPAPEPIQLEGTG